MDKKSAHTKRASKQKEASPALALPPPHDGLTIEYVLLSVTIVSGKGSAGQFDDSCAYLIEKHLPKYYGVRRVDAQVQYKHNKIEQHVKGCECGVCEPRKAKSVGRGGENV